MPLVFCTPGSSYTILVSKSTKLLSSLAMLNNKATQVKLENANHLATQTKQCNYNGNTSQFSYARALLLCYTSKKVTSKLHRQTNYKSNYTSSIYEMQIQACVARNANH